MAPFVVLMFLNIFIHYLRFVRSEGLDLLYAIVGDDGDYRNSQAYIISVSCITSLISIYFSLVVLGAYLLIKDEY
jgi:hypothetical protein